MIKARFSIKTVDCVRGKRLSGRTRMNFHSLVVHGLSAISVFSDLAGVRMILACMVLAGVTLAGICATVIIRLYTDLAIRGWATYTTGLLFVIMLQAVMMSFTFCFIVLNNRNAPMFVPIRDAGVFIAEFEDLFTK
jgi:hypothetical protein